MSYGDICKYCRAYKENHVAAQCPNREFELLDFDTDEMKAKMAEMAEMAKHFNLAQAQNKLREQEAQRTQSRNERNEFVDRAFANGKKKFVGNATSKPHPF